MHSILQRPTSALTAVYSGCSTPFFGAGLFKIVSEPSAPSPLRRFVEAEL